MFSQKFRGSNVFAHICWFFENILIKNSNPIALKNQLNIEEFLLKSSFFNFDTFLTQLFLNLLFLFFRLF